MVLTAILALALGSLPVGTARAELSSAPVMSCHEAPAGLAHDMSGSGHEPSDGMQDCADHCLSQVNGQPAFVRLAGRSLVNAIRAEQVGAIDCGKLHYRDPPDPPPPRP